MPNRLLLGLMFATSLWAGAVQTAEPTTEAPASAPKAAAKAAAGSICGAQMMTREERAEHMTKMRSAKTLEERERIRAEHYEAMQARAKERGVALPDEPPCRAGGMGPRGMGPGGRMMGPPER